jgi:hypothetical protein
MRQWKREGTSLLIPTRSLTVRSPFVKNVVRNKRKTVKEEFSHWKIEAYETHDTEKKKGDETANFIIVRIGYFFGVRTRL